MWSGRVPGEKLGFGEKLGYGGKIRVCTRKKGFLCVGILTDGKSQIQEGKIIILMISFVARMKSFSCDSQMTSVLWRLELLSGKLTRMVLRWLPIGTTAYQIKIKQLLPTRTTTPRTPPHQDLYRVYKPVKPLIRTNTCTVGNRPDGELSRIRTRTTPHHVHVGIGPGE